MFLSQSVHEITGCSDPLQSPSSITCVMYAAISTTNPFLTQTNGLRWNPEFFTDFCAQHLSIDTRASWNRAHPILNTLIFPIAFRYKAMLRYSANISNLLRSPELFVSRPRGNKVNCCLRKCAYVYFVAMRQYN